MFQKLKYKIKRKFLRHMEEYDITLEELKKKQLNEAKIIDVRNKREFEEEHLYGSINVPEYEINGNFEKIINNKDMEIIVYCTTGFRSTMAYKKLKKLGYKNVYNLYGGLENY